MADELIDIVDEDNNLTGIQKMKSEAHSDGSWHRTAHIWIYNSVGELLLQLRAKDKDSYPDKWDISAAGHIGSGEDIETGTLREVEEELGLSINKDNLEFLSVEKHGSSRKTGFINNEFVYVYLLRFDGDLSEITLQEEELQEAKFVSLGYLEDELKNNTDRYVPHGEYWHEIIDAVRNKIN